MKREALEGRGKEIGGRERGKGRCGRCCVSPVVRWYKERSRKGMEHKDMILWKFILVNQFIHLGHLQKHKGLVVSLHHQKVSFQDG